MEDSITNLFLRTVTNKSKPDISKFEGNETKGFLEKFKGPVVRRGVLYRHIRENGEDTFSVGITCPVPCGSLERTTQLCCPLGT